MSRSPIMRTPMSPKLDLRNDRNAQNVSSAYLAAPISFPDRIALIVTLLLAFGLRSHSLTRFQFHMDEYFTLAAADLIAQQGIPRFPTGLMYDPGLPFSYIAGVLFWLFGFSEALGRWPAVIFGTLSVATIFWLGRWVLRSNKVGIMAAVWLALSLESIEWAGRARMISLAQWLVLVSVALLWLAVSRQAARYRLLFALSYGVTLLSHFATIVLLPAWGVAAVALMWLNKSRLQWPLVRDGLFLVIILIVVLASGIYFQPPPNPDFAIGSTNLDEKTGELTGKFLQIPSDVVHAWEAYAPYFLEMPHAPLVLLVLVGWGISGYRLSRGQGLNNSGVLYLSLLLVVVIATLGLLISPHWQRARYLIMQVQGIFLLLAAHGLKEVVWLLPDFRWRPAVSLGAALLLSLSFLPPLDNLLTTGNNGWERYDLALKQVQSQIKDGDQVISMHPAAALLYLNQSDYYLVQSSPKLITRADKLLGDRYSGAIWLDSAKQFNALLAEPARFWLVTQEFWLFNSYDGYLQQQILWQMDKIWGEGGVWALAKRPGSWPLAAQPDKTLNAEFENGVQLVGYAANAPLSGGTVYLTLFWQGQNLPVNAKVFVHVRDAANNTVAQADHFIYDGKVPNSRWKALFENDNVIRDGATLLLPPDLAAGEYQLLVGFYHPDTFERLGVVNDQSGENGVVVTSWSIP